MKIDGYSPADEKVATEIGVELEYKTPLGLFHIRVKHSGSVNKAFQAASEKLVNRRAIRKATNVKQTSTEDLQDTLELWYDHAIISWSTTVKSDGKTIAPTRENFIDLLSEDPFVGVFIQLSNDAADVANFQAVEEEAVTKN